MHSSSSCSIRSQERQPRLRILYASGGPRRESSCSKASPQRSTIGSTTIASILIRIRRLCAMPQFDS
jgi:hypothetical protein